MLSIEPEAKKRGVIAIAIGGAALLCGVLLATYMEGLGLKFAANISNSLPGSLYWAKHEKFESFKAGDTVMFKLPVGVPKDYGFKKGDTFLKKIACVPHDIITVSEGSSGYVFNCNNVMIGSAYKKDKYGNPLAHPDIEGEIPDGKYFVATEHPKSFDSRYYGLIDKDDIIGKAILLY